MAVLFRIDATPGPSLFGTTTEGGARFYTRSVSGADPLYPAIYLADEADVISDKFDHDPAGAGDYQTCGWLLNPLGTESAGGPGAYVPTEFLNLGGPDQQGPFYAEAVFHPTTATMADIFYAPLFWFQRPNNTVLFGVYVQEPGTVGVGLEVSRKLDAVGSSLWSEFNPDFTTALHPVDGEPYTVRLEWLCGTVDSLFDVASDGWWRLLINGEEVTGQTNVPFYLDLSPTLVANVNKVGWANVGHDGLLGPWDYFEIGTIDQTVQAYIFGRGAAADDKATVVSDLTVLMNLDEAGRTVDEPNTLYVAGNLIVTGTTTFTGDVAATSPESLMDSIVTTGTEIVYDSSGNVVAVES